jgi:nucleoid-associated protein YgaU
MSRRFLAVSALIFIAVSGCATAMPRWRQDASIELDATRLSGADMFNPVEYRSAQDVFRQGELLLKEGEVADAEEYFHFAWMKGKLLEMDFAAEKVRRDEEARRRALEEKVEIERQRALLEEQRRAAQERKQAAETKSKAEKAKQPKERPLAIYHTVKRGETLPQIAAQTDVYNDYRLWPLLYRANRDQISNPKHPWPGQVLRIPRNVSREEMSEARRYAQGKPL